MAESFETRLRNELNARRNKNLFRETRTFDNGWLNLSANDYFLLRHNREVLTFADIIARKYGAGSGASPLLSGYLPCHEKLINKEGKNGTIKRTENF